MVATAPAGRLVHDTEAVSARTTLGVFLRQADRFGDRTFVRFRDNKSESWAAMSWREFGERVLLVAGGLIAAGVGPHARVVLLSENRVEWLLCDLGIQAAGAVTVPVHAILTPATVQFIAADSGAAFAIASNAAQEAKVAALAPALRPFSMETDLPRWLGARGATSTAVTDRLRQLGPDDIATIAYTSGTSGRPKGAVITHGIIVAELESNQKAYDIGPDDVILSILPLTHIFERIAAFYFGAVYAGAEVALGRGFETLLEDIHAVRPTCMDLVPRILEKFVQRVQAEVGKQFPLTRFLFAQSLRAGRERLHAAHPGWWVRARLAVADRLVLRRLRRRITGGRLRFFMSGSAPLAPDVEEFFWSIGIPVYQGWGMTELTCAATCNTIAEHRLGTVGKPLPGFELRLAPDGEIEVRGPGVMKEYFGNPAATAEAFTDGWLRTGDVGRLDEDGFLTITDRKKDLIKTSGGKYVAPQPIEVKLMQDPRIETAVVVGDGRRYVTALIVPDWAMVTREPGLDHPPDQLVGDPRVTSLIQRRVDEVNSELDTFETVKYFRILPRPLSIEKDELTPSLKIKRRVVQEHFRELIDEMYASDGRRLTTSPAG